MEGYLLEARQQISSRKFTAAMDILKRAEELDPVAPQLHTLMESAVAGQEQERRRREVEALVRDVEDALNKDDYRTACTKADEGLARFPEDRTLLKLKTLADRQHQVEERKRFVDEQLTMARVLLQADRNEELHEQLENAISRVGAEPRLESLLAVVGENLQRERMERSKAEGLRQARQALDNHAVHDAIQTLERLAKELGDDLEVRDLLTRARSVQAEAVLDALVRAEQEADLDQRMKMLKDALQMSPQDARLKEQLQNVGNLRQVIAEIGAEARQLEESRHYDRALAKWDTVRTVYPQYPDLKSTIARVRGLRERAHTDAHQSWIDRIASALSACDYEQALALVAQATQAFPWDTDLMELQEKTEAAVRQRAKAQKMLAEGRKLFANQQWEAGAQMTMRAYQLASEDSLIRDQAIGELAQASRATVQKNWRISEAIVRMLAEIQPSAVGSQDLHASIQERRREEAISGAMDAAKKRQASGDLEGALGELEQVQGWYPEDRRLGDFERLLQERLGQAREASRLEAVRQEAKSQRVNLLQGALASAEYKRAEDLLALAKRDFPGDREFAEIEKRVREGIANRAQAEKLLAGAAKSVDKGKWKKALESFQEANAAARSDRVIRDQVVSGLASAADAAFKSDCESSEMLAAEAARVDPDSPLLGPVRSKIEAFKRGRVQARESEPSRWKPVPPDAEDVSATRLFVQGMAPPSPEVSARIPLPAAPPMGFTESFAAPGTKQDPPPSAPIPAMFTLPTPATLGSSDGMTATQAQTLRDATLSPKDTRTATFDGGLTQAQPGLGSDQYNEAALQIIERQLAAFIGPLAKVLVKRAAGKTTSALELYTILAAVLEREEDRKAFLARRTELGGGKPTTPTPVSAPVQSGPAVTTTMDVSSPSVITPAAIEQAARRLAAHLGPIATVLARKDAKRAATLRDFYGLLAEHVANPADRERFLKEAGVQ
jgi:hypothetical protein